MKVELKGKIVFVYDEAGQLLLSSKFYGSDPNKTLEKIEKLADKLKLSDEKKDAITRGIITLYQQESQHDNSLPSAQPESSEVDPAIIEEAETVLKSTEPMNSIENYLDKIIAGERENKSLLFVLLLSGKYPDPKLKQIIILEEQPGAGKTTLANSLSTLFKTYKVGRLTAHALDYSDLSGYEVLYIQELGYLDAEDSGVSTLKFFSSEDGGYVVGFVIKDEKTGRFKAENKKIDPITIVTSTARVELDDSLKRRGWILSPDTSELQTKRVLAFKKALHEQEELKALGVIQETEKEHAEKVLKAIVRLIQPYEVVIPYRNTLYGLLNTKNLRSRGDADKLEALIKLLALIYQKTLPRIKFADNKEVLVATHELLGKALEIGYDALITMTTNVQTPIRKLIATIKSTTFTDGNTGRAGDVFTREDRERLATQLNVTEKTIRNYFKALADNGYAVEIPGQNREVWYKLLYDVEQILVAHSIIANVSGSPSGSLSGTREIPDDFRKKAALETIGRLSSLFGKILSSGAMILQPARLNYNDGSLEITYNPDIKPPFSVRKIAPGEQNFPDKSDSMKKGPECLEFLGFQINFQTDAKQMGQMGAYLLDARGNTQTPAPSVISEGSPADQPKEPKSDSSGTELAKIQELFNNANEALKERFSIIITTNPDGSYFKKEYVCKKCGVRFFSKEEALEHVCRA